MQTRVYNFSAGPATLPEPVLKQAQAELLNWNGLGCSVMEISHRSSQFMEMMQGAEQSLRALLNISNDYHVLFLGGATRTQFAMIPLNLLSPKDQAAYLVSGIWSSMAYDEASKLKNAYALGHSKLSDFTTLPEYHINQLLPDTTYLYYTPNETINGIRFADVPQCGDVSLIADMTSCLLSEPIEVNDYDLIFAGSQKNIGPAGLTIVIIRRALLEKHAMPLIPTMLDYRTHAQHASLYATPPTFNCYMTAKIFDWVKTEGGVEAMYQQNLKKSAKLYQAIDELPFYHCPIDAKARSLVNVCFNLDDPSLEEAWIKQAEKRGLYGLRGHRRVGGLRASIYNAMPMNGVDALIDFMRAFSK